MRSLARYLALALLVSGLAMAADKVTKVPVHFAKGASSASLKGSFSGYDTVEYTVGARAGQTMTVAVTGSNNANFNVFAPGDVPGQSTAIGRGAVGDNWSDSLPANGTYTVQVYQMRASARRGSAVPYSIRIGISGGAAASTSSSGGSYSAARAACLKALAKQIGVAQSSLKITNVSEAQSGVQVDIAVPAQGRPAPWTCLSDARGRVQDVTYMGRDGE